jgi:hypothetical protein
MLLLALSDAALGLNLPSHALVNDVAAREHPTLDGWLRNELGWLRGIRTELTGRDVAAWVGEGGVREDDGVRSFAHFHDPLRPWGLAGFARVFESSVRWMQNGRQEWSWRHARAHYHAALTAADPAEREQLWARTFRALGQLMHLVVDASVPEHVRDDPHPREAICRELQRRAGLDLKCYGNYEYTVSDEQARDEAAFRATYLGSAVGYHAELLRRASPDAGAPLPVAALIDSETYSAASGPNVTLGPGLIGVGEFANANFFSEDTADGRYPFPNLAALQPSRHPAPKTGRVRAYFRKGPGDGLPVDPALAECVLYRRALRLGVVRSIVVGCQDENVWRETARHMLPRAVGYSRGILDYFFRGRLELAPPERFVYAVAPYLEGNGGAFAELRLRVRNATPGEPAGPGQLVAVLQYRTAGANLLEQPAAPLSSLLYTVSSPVQATLTESFQEVRFEFPGRPLPANAADVFLTVIYRGPLGLESDAVAVGGRDLFEPTPVDIANITDYYCFSGSLYPVAGLPPFAPPLHVERDVTGDGVQDLFGPDDELGVFMKAGAVTGVPAATPGVFDAAVATRSFAQYTRYLVLVDQPVYTMSWYVQTLVERGTEPRWVWSGVPYTLTSPAHVNRLVLAADGQTLVHAFRRPIVYRGLVTLGLSLLAPQSPESFVPCLGASFTLSPSLTRIEVVLGAP